MTTVINGNTSGVHTSAAVECLQTISENYTISAGYNAGFFGPVTVDTGIIVTIPDGATLTIA